MRSNGIFAQRRLHFRFLGFPGWSGCNNCGRASVRRARRLFNDQLLGDHPPAAAVFDKHIGETIRAVDVLTLAIVLDREAADGLRGAVAHSHPVLLVVPRFVKQQAGLQRLDRLVRDGRRQR